MNHFWQGQWFSEAELTARLEGLPTLIAETLTKPWSLTVVLDTCERFSRRLQNDDVLRAKLEKPLREAGELLPGESMEGVCLELAAFLARENLRTKVRRELGDEAPFEVRRLRYDEHVFEHWAPLGFLVHVTPANVFSVAALSAIEGLLTGNINFVKTSGSASLFTHFFFEEFLRDDESGRLKDFILISRLSSKQSQTIAQVLDQADGLAAWGGEEAIAALKKDLPPTARLIAWGHRLSFAYVAKNFFTRSETLRALAHDVCALDQQACSSPQAIYLETDDVRELQSFAVALAQALREVSETIPRKSPGDGEAAELSMVVAKHKISEAFGLGTSVVDPANRWRVLVDHRKALTASPLFRTIWVKPLPATEIISTLRPLRGYLQSVGLAAEVGEFPALTKALRAAGVLRVRPLGRMIESYPGEPHDGEYALARYARRISTETDARFAGISTFAQIEDGTVNRAPVSADSAAPVARPITSKAQFQAAVVDASASELFFKSGGSTGEPKISVFTYADYKTQMRCAAEGLYAAGLDPVGDRCMNLFFGGGLYGGFLSFFSVLEALHAKQFPMAAHHELDVVIDTIIKFKVNVLLGMPSYLLQLFTKGGQRLAQAGVVKKVFYGGEHFTSSQKKYLKQEFGVEVIRSASYGSVDAGPLGYQCAHCEGSVHHLNHELQSLEIMKLDRDLPVEENEIGRLLFTSKVRQGQNLTRYEIGDLGRWVLQDCACGRRGARFELLGRHGDVFRVGGSYLNARKWEKILSEDLAYRGEFQIVLTKESLQDHVELRFQETPSLPGLFVVEALLSGDPDLRELVRIDKVLTVIATNTAPNAFERTAGSGKLIRVLDRRTL